LVFEGSWVGWRGQGIENVEKPLVFEGSGVGWRGQGIENVKKPLVFGGFSSEMLKKHWFLGGGLNGPGGVPCKNVDQLLILDAFEVILRSKSWISDV